ncbi:MAG: restriction endonuclease, partial [Planctomycetota bacterium]
LLEFDRRDPNVLPPVNLRPRQRYHRIYAVDDFVKSIENLKSNKITLADGQSSGEFHLIEKTERFLAEISALIQEMNRSKNLERFLAKVFRRLPGVINVLENGFGWGTDFGADLIVTTKTSIEMLDFENTVVVQVKSYTDSIYDLNAVDQIKTAIEEFSAAAGMIVTTAEKTEELEQKIVEVSGFLGVPIDLLAGDDLARFVLRNAPEMLFRLERNR